MPVSEENPFAFLIKKINETINDDVSSIYLSFIQQLESTILIIVKINKQNRDKAQVLQWKAHLDYELLKSLFETSKLHAFVMKEYTCDMYTFSIPKNWNKGTIQKAQEKKTLDKTIAGMAEGDFDSVQIKQRKPWMDEKYNFFQGSIRRSE